MLPKNARLTTSADFTRATKSGTRVTTDHFVGYLYFSPTTNQLSINNEVSKFGLIISKSVGGSVVRHTLARKLRHAVAPHISKLPAGSLLVIRALTKNNSGTVVAETEKLIAKLLDRSARSVAK